MISNNKISTLVNSSVPFYVRNDHPNFVRFIEAYYEFLEEEQNTINRFKLLPTYQDIDLTLEEFEEHLWETYLKLIPRDIIADKALLLKHIKDFYRARGTEKSTRFLMRILFGEEIDIYYPKKDILKVSDGKWYVQKSLRISDTNVNGTYDDSLNVLDLFIGTRIIGGTSNAHAIVERVDRFFEQGRSVDELIISNIKGNFLNGENISTNNFGGFATSALKANIFGGIINSITIDDGGTNYQIGDPVIIISNTGSGACAYVSSVSTGNISSILVKNDNFGAGFQNGNPIIATGGGGTGFNAYISLVDTSETYHPNSYSIVKETIELEKNTLLNGTFTNYNSANINFTIANATSTWTYGNTGPLLVIFISDPGSGFTTNPSISIVANSTIQQMGILGRMEIENGGSGYAIGNEIEFINAVGSYGVGATANVTNVSGSGAITAVRFQKMPGHTIGGSGYNQELLPRANVISGTGTGANIAVTALLGYGPDLQSANGNIGTIERIVIQSMGYNYDANVTIDLSDSGDGKAKANADVITGYYSYPGRFLNDDGKVSSFNFLEDEHYYQNYSYAIRVKKSIKKYREAFKTLTHPSGMRLFGEYTTIDDNLVCFPAGEGLTEEKIKVHTKNYTMNSNVVNVSFTSHGLSNGNNIYLEYQTGGYANVKNGKYSIVSSTSNWFEVNQVLSGSANTSGIVEVGVII